MSTADQSIASQSSHLLAGQVQTLDPAEDNQVLGLLYEYETVQLNQGAFSRHVQFAGTERSALYVEEYGARSHNLGALRGDRLAFCLPMMETESRWWGRSISHGVMPMSHSGKTIHATFDAGQRHVVMILDRQWCLEELSRGMVGQILNIESILNPQHSSFLEIHPLQVQRWSQRLCRLLTRVVSWPEKVPKQQFESELLTAVRSLLEPAEVSQLIESRSKQVVEMTLTYADAFQSQSPTVSELCANVNVSRRTLEVAFQTIVGKSPLQFLTQRRLCRAYVDLKRAKDESIRVTDIAFAHGFTELGRFANRYQKIFGELPSETLRQYSSQRRLALEI
ncbi:MAG: AraC family transcriptional regulator [Phycisphaeraceae bacterium]|nr:MAG: AraC family transcriptional regulator [Phycisphaeraceae bacterium]|tara:strand:- start:676 stop:1686 length:1011 start_codon:yes stop_codon:yes gene_type:complete